MVVDKMQAPVDPASNKATKHPRFGPYSFSGPPEPVIRMGHLKGLHCDFTMVRGVRFASTPLVFLTFIPF